MIYPQMETPVENGNGKTNGNVKTSVYLPPDLYAVLRNRSKLRNISIQDVIREALTTAMDVEDDGILEKIDQLDAKWKAEMQELAAKLDAIASKRGGTPASEAA